MIEVWVFKFNINHENKDHPYLVHVERFRGDVFIVKFYQRKDKNLPAKLRYSKRTNLGAHIAIRIFHTCIDISSDILKGHPDASFGFLGMPDSKDHQGTNKTQRFRIYSAFANRYFNPENWEHQVVYEKSLYFLINKSSANPTKLLKSVKQVIEEYDYDSLL